MDDAKKFLKGWKPHGKEASVRYGDSIRFEKARDQATFQPIQIGKIEVMVNKFLGLVKLKKVINPVRNTIDLVEGDKDVSRKFYDEIFKE